MLRARIAVSAVGPPAAVRTDNLAAVERRRLGRRQVMGDDDGVVRQHHRLLDLAEEDAEQPPRHIFDIGQRAAGRPSRPSC